jgi:hypothetical protein
MMNRLTDDDMVWDFTGWPPGRKNEGQLFLAV